MPLMFQIYSSVGTLKNNPDVPKDRITNQADLIKSQLCVLTRTQAKEVNNGYNSALPNCKKQNSVPLTWPDPSI